MSTDSQHFSVPAPFYWAVKTVHVTAPALVALGNIESTFLARRIGAVQIDRPIYICGLPRAGTTISLQMLSENPKVATHKYADFLMPYTPYVWNQIFPWVPVNTMKEPTQRIHRDRIKVTRDSAEMCEEMIWEQFFPSLYDEAVPSFLDRGASNVRFEKFYTEHIQKLLLVRRRKRYVSKAIMCVLRMQYLRKIFPDVRFLLYVRNPIHQIASLLKQDRIWDEIDQHDPRQIAIIEMTGHHEFGRRQIVANLGNEDQVREIRALLDAGQKVRARSRCWAYTYDFVLRQMEADPDLRSSVCIVKYEDLCSHSIDTIDRITEHTGLPSFNAVRDAYAAKLSFPDYYKPNFSKEELDDLVQVTAPIAEKFGYDLTKGGTS